MDLVRQNTDDFSVFVGDLAPDVTDYVLQETFRQYYPSVRSAKVIVDPATGRSKGYGFVRFASEEERDRSLELQGLQLSSRPIRVSLATARRSSSAGMPGVHPAELDPTNTTLFIGGLSAGVSEEQLRAIFVRYGEVVYTKIPQGKGCGFVQFVQRPDAEVAMAEMNGQVVGTSAIRISWGRSTSRAAALQLRAAGGFGACYPGGPLDAYAAAPAAVAVGGMGGVPGSSAGGAAVLYGAGGAAGGVYGAAAAAGGLSGGYPVADVGLAGAGQAGYAMPGLAPVQAGGLQQLQPALGTASLGAGGQQQLLHAQLLQAQPLQAQQLQAQQQQQQQLLGGVAGVDVSKLNAMFLQQQEPMLNGGFMRPMG